MKPNKGDVIAIVCADIHLSHKAPVARAGESNWYEAMHRTLIQLEYLQREYCVPILCAGDVFDRWNSPPALINFALGHLPEMHTIPGQHDLPYHLMENIKSSAYHTLVLAKRIFTLAPEQPIAFPHMTVHGFGWGVPIRPVTRGRKDTLKVALVHEYWWHGYFPGTAYTGAPERGKLCADRNPFDGFDVVVIGDNHCPWEMALPANSLTGRTTVFNCGGLMMRKSDDRKPRVGLVTADGEVHSVAVDVGRDVFCATPGAEDPSDGATAEFGEFLATLHSLVGTTLDFREAVDRAMDRRKVTPGVRAWVTKAMETK